MARQLGTPSVWSRTHLVAAACARVGAAGDGVALRMASPARAAGITVLDGRASRHAGCGITETLADGALQGRVKRVSNGGEQAAGGGIHHWR